MSISVKKRIYDKNTGETTYESLAAHYDVETGEQIETSEIQVERVVWDRSKGELIVSFSIGGTDASGNYKRNYKYPDAKYPFGRTTTAKLWNDLNLDTYPSPETLDELLVKEKAAISTIGRRTWNLPALAVNPDEQTKTEEPIGP